MLTSDVKEKDIEVRAKDVVNNLAIVIKTSQLHNVNNVAVVKAVHKFLEILNPLVSSEEITLQLMEEFFHLNGGRVRYTVEYSSNFDFIIEEFKKIGLGTIIFEKTMTEDKTEGTIALLSTKIAKRDKADFFAKCIESEVKPSTVTRKLISAWVKGEIKLEI